MHGVKCKDAHIQGCVFLYTDKHIAHMIYFILPISATHIFTYLHWFFQQSVKEEETDVGFCKFSRIRRFDLQPNGKDLKIKVMDVKDSTDRDMWEPTEAVQVQKKIHVV